MSDQEHSTKTEQAAPETASSPEQGVTAPSLEAPSTVGDVHSLDDFEHLLAGTPSKPKLKELIQSSDSPSRYMTALSMIFALLALVCFGTLIRQYLKYRHNVQNEAAAKAEEARLYGGWLNGQHYFKKKGPDGIDPLITQALGEFRVSWKGAELRVDLVAECTDEATCNELKDKALQVRDLLLPMLQASNQEEIMNPNRKLALRRNLAEKLNDLNLKGKVIQIDFNDMTIESGPKSE